MSETSQHTSMLNLCAEADRLRAELKGFDFNYVDAVREALPGETVTRLDDLEPDELFNQIHHLILRDAKAALVATLADSGDNLAPMIAAVFKTAAHVEKRLNEGV